MRKRILTLIMCVSIAMTIIFIGSSMSASHNEIVQVTFRNSKIDEKSITIHAKAQCLEDYEITAIQCEENEKKEGMTELEFTATENRDYSVKVYYRSLVEQKEQIEIFITTVDKIVSQVDEREILADNSDIVDTEEFKFDKSTGTILRFKPSSGRTNINIPSQIDGVKVEIIGKSAFANCIMITDVHIPDTVTRIEDNAFSCCNILKSINIPDSVISIGSTAFGTCYQLTSIEFPDSVQSIGSNCFFECINLENVRLSHSMTKLDFSTFRHTLSLKSIEIPKSVKEMYGTVFTASALTEIIIPNSVELIWSDTFIYCNSLKTAYIPNTVTTFYGGFVDTSLQNVVIMCNDPNDIDLPSNSHFFSIENADTLNWFRITPSGKIDLKQSVIHSYENRDRTVKLDDVFDISLSEKIYEGTTGQKIYTGNDINVPKDYWEPLDETVEYQLIGKPTSPHTKIKDNILYIDKNEKASDLKVSARYIETAQEIPIKINNISSLIIKKEPLNTYTEKERYNPNGLIVTLQWEDGYQEDIAYHNDIKDDFSFAYDELNLTIKKQVITYKGFSVEHNLIIEPFYKERILNDKGISIKGKFTKDSYLIVEKMRHVDHKYINELTNKVIIGQYEARIIGDYEGELFITFDVGKENNGQKIYIRCFGIHGDIINFEGTVEGGQVSITVEELAPFLIYMDERIEINTVEKYTPDTSDDISIVGYIGMIIVSLAVYINRNKMKIESS